MYPLGIDGYIQEYAYVHWMCALLPLHPNQMGVLATLDMENGSCLTCSFLVLCQPAFFLMGWHDMTRSTNGWKIPNTHDLLQFANHTVCGWRKFTKTVRNFFLLKPQACFFPSWKLGQPPWKRRARNWSGINLELGGPDTKKSQLGRRAWRGRVESLRCGRALKGWGVGHNWSCLVPKFFRKSQPSFC